MRLVRWKRVLGVMALLGAATTALISCSRQSHRVEVVETAASGGPSAPLDSSPPAVQTPPARRVHSSTLAGTWYEADKDALGREIRGYLDKAPDERLPDICALVLPHAGYRYSGETAAWGVRQLAGRKFSRVVVIGPTHRWPIENIASVPEATHYATPLGEIPLDWRFLSQLRSHAFFFKSIPQVHDGEHSVEIELPLLQQALGQFQLAPIVVGELDAKTARAIAKILLGLIDQETLVVVSSDFTHYGDNFGYFPFREDVAANLKKLDMGALERIERKDMDAFFAYVDQTGATICGRHAIGVLLAMLPAQSKARLLRYDTSGRMTNDYSSSVSYLSIAFTGKWPRAQEAPAKSAPGAFADEDKKQLLKLARATLTYVLEKQQLPTPEQLNIRLTPAMAKKSGAFVTLHKRGELRGCIGEMEPARPLYEAVMAQAVNAGLNDRRFSPVEASELAELEFEISALSAPRPASLEEIVIGKHGIILQKDGRSAVFLPQVAVEQGWKLEETLAHLSLKAGLPEQAWKNGASFAVFEAVVFGEGRP